MRIGIIGAGAMADALGSGWARAGHEVLIGARSVERARALAERIGGVARSGTIAEAVTFGDVTLLAVPGEHAVEVLGAAGAADGRLAGRPLIDCTNALALDASFGPPHSVILAQEAVAEGIAEAAPGAGVVKAFSMCAAEVWAGDARSFDGCPLGVPLCTDDVAALATVSVLVRDLGLAPVDGGGLRRARYVEAMTAFVMGLWFAGSDARAVLPPLEAAAGAPDRVS